MLKSSDIIALLKKTADDSRNWDMSRLGKPLTISFLNAHGLNTATRNTPFFDFLMDSDFLLRDGIGIKLALKLFNLGETQNLNGTDLITKIILSNTDMKLAIFGASDAALSACRQKLSEAGVTNIVSMEHGFHEDGFYLKICDQLKPDLVVLCMGMPRQELLAKKMKAGNFAGILICGGGWADFYSGIKIRAPLWMRKLSLEWLHRLIKEPKRLGRRYTIDILYYFYVIAVARFCGKKN